MRQFRTSRYNEAAGILRDLIQSPRFVEFLTLPAYEKLNAANELPLDKNRDLSTGWPIACGMPGVCLKISRRRE